MRWWRGGGGGGEEPVLGLSFGCVLGLFWRCIRSLLTPYSMRWKLVAPEGEKVVISKSKRDLIHSQKRPNMLISLGESSD
jgi:hypothetical protein